jgi:PAS domain S-box-containing protein
MRSEERFGKAFRANPQPMTITTFEDGRYIEVNRSFLELSGFSRDEVIGHTALELGMWQTPEDRSEFIEKTVRSDQRVSYESKIRTKSGEVRTALLAADRLTFAGHDCVMICAIDITDRKHAEEALRESEARFRNMADTAPVMIWVSGVDRETTYLNKEWLELRGRTLEEELGHGWAVGIHPDDRSEAVEIYHSSFDRRQSFEMEFRILRHDEEYRWIVARGTPRFSSSDEFLGYIGTCIDITERKESAEALIRANEELKELKNKLEAENIYLHQELQQDQTFGDIVGQSAAIKYVLFKVSQVAPTDSSVLVMGETGTGKELIARAIHEASPRKDRPLIRVNCAALSPTLIESELFGHEKGSFTGASGRKVGRFELANHGTLMLDEIGELPLDLLAKLLRVLQEGEFERVGGVTTIKMDVRVIAMTNRDLEREAERGRFREDLWYRLNVFPITTPPLRDRREDIPILAEHFTRLLSRKFGKEINAISPDTMAALTGYAWPGNLRELANVIERAVINSRGSVLRLQEDLTLRQTEISLASTKTLEETERDHITAVLSELNWRIDGPRGGARVLGINASTLRTRMAKLGIHKPNGASSDQ